METMEARQPEVIESGALASIGACRSVKVTSVSEIGWWNTERFVDDIKQSGGESACQWDMHFDPDNAAGSCSLLEVEGSQGGMTRILLDAGWNPEYISERFRTTGIDRLLREGRIDFMYLSHEHLDHYWGIEAVLKLAPEITILVPGTISDEGLGWLKGKAFPAAGIENRVPHRGKVVRMLPGGIHRLAVGVASVTFDVPIWLDVRGEQSIYINVEGKGLVCVTGCCHQGVLNLIDYAVDHLEDGRRPYGLFGGLHIAPVAALTDEQRKTVHALGRYGFQKIAANHCTGADAIALMHELGYPILGGSGQHGSTGTDHVGNGDVVGF
jgi:7,8-dihydropterin-6-yl-methyl-4-(beta-D-ribofuranosyl)aminobenzene 5'-phosphate synthase